MFDILIYILYFIVGAVLGSFANVVIYRLPRNISLISPPSTCFECGKKIKWYENIPIISFIFLRGKCSKCKTKISFRDFLVELISALLFLIIAIVFFNKSIIASVILCLTTIVLTILSCIDLDSMYVPISLILILLGLGVVSTCFNTFGSTFDHLIGLLVGGGFLLVIYLFGYIIKKREVVGLGDIELMAVSGLLLGWKCIIFSYLIGCILASIVLVITKLVSKNKEKNKEYPFVPFLAIGLIVSMFVGNIAVNWYLGLF